MKRLGLVTLLLLATIAVAMASIANEMKTIGSHYKTITLTINDSASNSSNIALIDKIQTAFRIVREIPPSASTANEFQILIDQVLLKFSDLKIALNNNDNVNAASVVQEINLIRKEAHAKFK
jgi:hypothetical protein